MHNYNGFTAFFIFLFYFILFYFIFEKALPLFLSEPNKVNNGLYQGRAESLTFALRLCISAYIAQFSCNFFFSSISHPIPISNLPCLLLLLCVWAHRVCLSCSYETSICYKNKLLLLLFVVLLWVCRRKIGFSVSVH